jgi:excisionase family DNA binding protein
MDPVGDVHDDIDALATVEEIADELGRSVATIRRWCASGRLSAQKVGRGWLVYRSSLRNLEGRRRPRPRQPDARANIEVALGHVAALDLRDRDIGIPDVLRFQDLLADRTALLQDVARVLSGESPLGPTIEVELPKSSFFTRTTQLLTIEDRIAYQAMVAAFAREVDRNLLPTVFGGRLSIDNPKLFLRDGVADWHTWRRSLLSQIKAGREWMIRTDVTAYFDSIQHSLLFASVEAVSPHEPSLDLLKRMLRHWAIVPGVGIPQGPNASRLLQNAYFYPIDLVMVDERWYYSRYIDDIRILAKSRADAMIGLKTLERECRRRGLVLSAHKTALLRAADAMNELTNRAFTQAQYQFDRWNHKAAKAILRDLLKQALRGGEGTVDVRPLRFSLWRLLWLHDRWARDRILQRIDDLGPAASLVALYLGVWVDDQKVADSIGRFLVDRERNTSPYLATWLLAMLLEARRPLTPQIVTYARGTLHDRNQPAYLRVFAANVLSLGRQVHDLQWLRDEIRKEFDPYVARGYLVALARIGQLDNASIARSTARLPVLSRTVAYLRGRGQVPSLIHSRRVVEIGA